MPKERKNRYYRGGEIKAMTDDPTKNLTADEKLNLILQRLAALEAQGANSTRPVLDRAIQDIILTRETIMARLGSIETEMRLINRKLEVLNRERLDQSDR